MNQGATRPLGEHPKADLEARAKFNLGHRLHLGRGPGIDQVAEAVQIVGHLQVENLQVILKVDQQEGASLLQMLRVDLTRLKKAQAEVVLRVPPVKI